ncbi:MAG: hypothetical protein ABH840_04520 [Nanoarchaeota archaeon]
MKDNLRRDFEVFSQGIKRLEELRAELDGLNTRGFEAEASAIRSKMKNVSEIPFIERDLKRLKLKISGRYKPKPRKNLVEKKIKDVEKEIDRKLYSCRTNIKYAKEVPKLKKQLEALKVDLDKRKKQERRKREILKRIDPSVDLLANESFDLSLSEIKAELSERIRNREAEIHRELEDDLKMREMEFKKRYDSLDKSYKEKYEQTVEKQLKKEIHYKFNKLLQARIKERKVELTKQELVEIRLRAEKDFEVGKIELKRKYLNDLNNAKKQLKQHFEEEMMLHKHEAHKKFEREIASKVWEIKRKYREREKQMINSLRSKESNELEKNSTEFKQIIHNARMANIKLSKELALIKGKLIEQRQKDRIEQERVLQKKIEAQNSIQKKLADEKEALAKELLEEIKAGKEKVEGIEKKFDRKLNLEIKKKESEKDKKVKLEMRKKEIEKDEIEKLEKEIAKMRGELEKERQHERKEGLRVKQLEKEKKKMSLNEKERESEKNKEEEKKLVREREQQGLFQRLFSKERALKKKLAEEVKLKIELARNSEESQKKLKDMFDDLKEKEKKMRAEMEAEKEKEIQSSLRKRTDELRNMLKKEFSMKLNLEIKKKEAEFEKKKSEFEQDIKDKAKSLFN